MTDKYPSVTDPGIRQFLIEGEKLYPKFAVNFTMAEQRAFYDQFCAHFSTPRPAGVTTKDFKVDDVPCRTYSTSAARAKMIYLHGGGYVVGGIESHDSICAEMCDQAQIEVTAVQYRLAPEHPFPAAFDDCWAVLNHIGPCILVGDSAGGNMAAALSLKSRDVKGPKVQAQILIYPGLGGDMTRGSYVTQAQAPGLSTKDVIFYRDTYNGSPNKYAEPLRETNYANLPPAFMIAAGLDPLHDDCRDYAAKLKAAGVAAEVRSEPLLIHGFLRARHMSQPAADSFSAIIAAIRKYA